MFMFVKKKNFYYAYILKTYVLKISSNSIAGTFFIVKLTFISRHLSSNYNKLLTNFTECWCWKRAMTRAQIFSSTSQVWYPSLNWRLSTGDTRRFPRNTPARPCRIMLVFNVVESINLFLSLKFLFVKSKTFFVIIFNLIGKMCFSSNSSLKNGFEPESVLNMYVVHSNL